MTAVTVWAAADNEGWHVMGDKLRIGEYRKEDVKPETERDKVAISVLLDDIS